jgi:hypothetical protein
MITGSRDTKEKRYRYLPSNGFGRFNGLELVNSEALVHEMARSTVKHTSNYSRWRTEPQSTGDKPPPNFLAIIGSLPGCARMWGELPEKWRCHICERSKYEVVSYKKGKVSFNTHGPARYVQAWRSIGQICIGCFNIVSAMKRELQIGYELEVSSAFDCITPSELRSIIRPSPHSSHLVDAEMAKALVSKWQLR